MEFAGDAGIVQVNSFRGGFGEWGDVVFMGFGDNG